MPMFKVGDVLDVESELVEFVCCVSHLRAEQDIKQFEDCVAVYEVCWEGGENPDDEPMIVIWEYTNGDVYASDDSKPGFDYHKVEVKKIR